MATKITQCSECKSYIIKELNPGFKKTANTILCTVMCECKDCGFRFNKKSPTDWGRRKGVKY